MWAIWVSVVSEMTGTSAPFRHKRARGALLMIAMTGLANLLTLVYQVLVGRALGPSAYGLFSSIFVIIGMIGVATSGLQLGVAQSLAAGRADAPRASRVDGFTRHALVLSVIAGAGVLLASPALAAVIKIGIEPFVALALYVPVAALLSVVGGRFQGVSRIAAFTAFSLAIAVGKLLSAVPVLLAGLGATSYLLSFAAASAAVAVVAYLCTLSFGSVSESALSPGVRRAFWTMTLYWFISNVDVVAARVLLPEETAGHWAAASVLAKAALILPALVALIILPVAVKHRTAGLPPDHLARSGLLFALAAAAVPIALLAAGGAWLVEILYGERFAPAGDLAPRIALAVVPLALAHVLLQFHLARERNAHLVPLAAMSVLAPLLLLLAAPSVDRFVWALAGYALTTLVLVVPFHRWRRLMTRSFGARPDRERMQTYKEAPR